MDQPAAATPTFLLQRHLVEWRDSRLVHLPKTHATPPGAVLILERLIQAGANLDLVDQLTPCIPFVFWDPLLILFFLQNGRDVNAQDYAGNTALHLAAFYTRGRAIKFLLDHNADPHVKNNMGETPLWIAINATRKYGLDRLANFNLLLNATTDLNFKNADGLTYLHAAISSSLWSEHIRALLDRFPDVDIRSSGLEKTPLMSACENDNSNLCRILVQERNADVNARDILGRTPFHYALSHGYCIKILLSSGALDMKEILPRIIDTDYIPMFKRHAVLHEDIWSQIVLYEMKGARYILWNCFEPGLSCLEKALVLRTESNSLEPLPPQTISEDDLGILWEIMLLEGDVAPLYREAVTILERILNGSCWSIMQIILMFSEDIIRSFHRTRHEIIKDMLNHVVSNMTAEEVEMFEHVEITQKFFDYFSTGYYSSETETMMIDLFSSHSEFFMNLAVAPFKWWKTNFGNRISCIHLKYIIEYITSIHNMTELGATSSQQSIPYLETFISFDFRDNEGNGLLHLACKDIKSKLVHLLLEYGADVRAVNLSGQTPMELLLYAPYHMSNKLEKVKPIVLELISRGAHIDYQRVPSLNKSIFDTLNKLPDFNYKSYISLQCFSARAVARGGVNFKDWIPKRMQAFVENHF